MNQPRLRFKEFKGEWEKTKFGNIMDSFSYGLSVTSKKYDGVNKYLRITDIDDNSRKFKVNGVVSPNANLSENENYILKKGDLVFARTGASTGKSYLYDDNDGIVYFAGFLIKAKVKRYIDRYFIFFQTFTHKYWEFIKINSMRSGQPGINIGSLKSFKFNIPNYPEQQKIGQFFQNLNQQIEFQSDKLEHLKKCKQGYLQKMIPGMLTKLPQVRFNKFNLDWKNFKLKYLLSETKLKQDLTPYAHRLLTVKLHFEGIKPTNKYPRITQSGRKYYYRHAGEIIIGKQNFQNGGFGIASKEVDGLIASSAIMSLDVTDQANKYFIYYAMTNKNWLRETTRYLNGTGQKEYGTKTFMNLKISVPSLPEQQLIGQFFSHLNHLINLQQQKVDHLKQLKQAYLQKMFV